MTFPKLDKGEAQALYLDWSNFKTHALYYLSTVYVHMKRILCSMKMITYKYFIDILINLKKIFMLPVKVYLRAAVRR